MRDAGDRIPSVPIAPHLIVWGFVLHQQHIMRVIEQQMLDAIRNRKDWRSSNTRTECTHFAHGDRIIDRVTVYLHNNAIASITPTDVTICDCGWQSPTTKSRLNAILHELCGAGVYQKNHKWYGTAIEETDWEIELWSRHCFVRG